MLMKIKLKWMLSGVQVNASSSCLLSDVQRDGWCCFLLSRMTLDVWKRKNFLNLLTAPVLSLQTPVNICSREKRGEDTWCFMHARLVALYCMVANGEEMELCFLLSEIRMKSWILLFQSDLLYVPVKETKCSQEETILHLLNSEL